MDRGGGLVWNYTVKLNTMGKKSLWKRFKEWIGGIGWGLFIWGQYDGKESTYMDAIRLEVFNSMNAEPPSNAHIEDH